MNYYCIGYKISKCKLQGDERSVLRKGLRHPTFSVILFINLMITVGCSSTQTNVGNDETIRPFHDYNVVLASSTPLTWNRDGFKSKGEGNYLFRFSSGPKITKEIACNMVRAYGKDEIVDFMISALRERDSEKPWDLTIANEGRPLLNDLFSKNLASLKVLETYWEKRVYPATLQTEKETQAYSCSLLIAMKDRLFDKAILALQNLVKERHLDLASVQKETDQWSAFLKGKFFLNVAN